MPWRLLALLCLLLALAACAPWPRDAEHTTETVRGGELRVGVIHDPPFVSLRPGAPPSGREVRMAQALAHSLDARVVWVEGGADELFEDVEQFRLDLVIGGISPQSPWGEHVALTLPYRVRGAHGRLVQRVAAVPPGENRWQMRVERFQRSPLGQRILQAPEPVQ